MAKRYLKATRLEALAVLRGEMDYHERRMASDAGRAPAIAALQRAIDVLERTAAPSGPTPSADPGIARRLTGEAFMEGMMGEGS